MRRKKGGDTMNAIYNTEKLNEKKRVHGFNVMEDTCIWMKAGVINFRKCDNDYDCSSCGFDKSMRKAMSMEGEGQTEKIAPKWVEHLQKTYYGAARPCRHALTGRIDAPKICTMNYECYHCSFDQLLDETDLTLEMDSPRVTSVSGYKMAKGYYYHMGHSWSRFEHGGRVRVGIDDFSGRVFGSPKRVVLPPLGEKLKQNYAGWTFARNGHEAAVLSPVTGVVLAVNHNALEHPEIVHADPYHAGWLLIVEPVMPKRDLKGLYFGRESFQWMENEGQSLLSLLGPEYENLAATGAEPIGDVFGAFPEVGWHVLVETFLHTGKVA
jgi:glycine cleavage system H lipoate-binding protein